MSCFDSIRGPLQSVQPLLSSGELFLLYNAPLPFTWVLTISMLFGMFLGFWTVVSLVGPLCLLLMGDLLGEYAWVPGPVGLWRHGCVGWPCIEVRCVDVGFWPYSVGLLVKLCFFSEFSSLAFYCL